MPCDIYMAVDFGPIASTATSVGFGGITGFLIGYAIKKVVKVILVIVGLVFVSFVFLEYQKIITVNWNKIQTSAIEAIGNATSGQVMQGGGIPGAEHITTTMNNFGIPITGSLTAGFVLGFMRG
jgi:uncharacterized membrane protein (Fun14 family)